ncbi:hypothetical protein AZE42_12336 [Rhizopogon vesiculosus]|uniref:Uncharacterized protein n=1 Tax=Rhizopogon vesiculosus TaxID=180088 RepID=A0A1J8PQ82_9AGAM|nr:hypothetical protein AZE42_12336 [Rhizopogon vesiculosus]
MGREYARVRPQMCSRVLVTTQAGGRRVDQSQRHGAIESIASFIEGRA